MAKFNFESVYFNPNICIVCDNVLGAVESDFHSTSEDEVQELREFICKIFCIPSSCFEYSGFPLCHNCTSGKIKQILRMHRELMAMNISYAALKEALLRDIVTVYFNRIKYQHTNNEKAYLKDVLINKWKNYSLNFPTFTFADKNVYVAKEANCFQDEIKEEFEWNDNNNVDQDINDTYNNERNDVPELDQSTSEMMSQKTKITSVFSLDKLDDTTRYPIVRKSNRLKRKQRHKIANYSANEDSNKSLMPYDDSSAEEISKSENDTITCRLGGISVTNFSSCNKFRKVNKAKMTSNAKTEGNVKRRRIKRFLQCPHCPKKIKGTDCLKYHIRVHTGERPHMCSECNQRFRQHAHLSTHKKLRHGYGGKTKTVEGLNEIASKNRSYYCGFCCAEVKTKGRFMRHLMDKHMGKEIGEGDSVWFYYCDEKECLVSCASQDQLKKHFLQSHKNLLENCSEFPQCDICQRSFISNDNLKIHKNGHPSGNKEDNQSMFSCDYCYQVFESKDELNEHLPRHQLTYKSETYFHLCDLCGKSYADLSTLALHKRKSHKQKTKPPSKHEFQSKRFDDLKDKENNKNYKCSICFTWYASRGHFTRHLKLAHLNKEIKDGDSFWFYDCDVKECKAACPNVEHLNRHTATSHKNILDETDIPRCNICQRAFVLQENLEQHKYTHPDSGIPCDQLKICCDYCPDVFLSAFELDAHKAEHKITFDLSEFSRILCNVCGKGFRYHSNLYTHKRIAHSEKKTRRKLKKDTVSQSDVPCSVNNTNDINNSNILKCSLCPYTTSKPTALQLHTEKIHPSVETPSKLLKYSCEYCEKNFRFQVDVHRHSIRQHQHEYLQGKSFCSSCYKTFETEDETDTHFNEIHPHLICPVENCRKKFSTNKRFDLHMNIHKNEKPFICEYCTRGFKQEATLQSHINTKHTFHRSFLCKLCPDNPGYYERRTFNKHMAFEHPTAAVKDILITNYPKRKYFF